MNFRHAPSLALLTSAVLATLAAATAAQAQTPRGARTTTAAPVATTKIAPVTNDTTTTSAATLPVGFTTMTAVGKTGNSSGYNFFSLDLVRPAVYRAVVPTGGASASNGQTTLSFPGNTFTNNQFNGTGNASYVEVTNGQYAGLTANVLSTQASDSTHGGASTITLDLDLSSAITAGTTTFLVRPHWTFGTAFGVNNTTGLQGSFSASNADSIQIIDPTTGAITNYYYNTTNNQWQTLNNDATNVIIPPGVGLNIQRKQATSASFTVVGEVKIGQSALVVVGGSTPSNSNLIPNPYAVASVALANSNLYTGNPTTGVAGSFSASAADSVGILDPTTGAITNYYYNTTNNQWQTLNNDASTYMIPAGAAVLITRKSGRPSFVWYVPQPAMNL